MQDDDQKKSSNVGQSKGGRALDGRCYMVVYEEGESFEKALHYTLKLVRYHKGYLALAYLYKPESGAVTWGNVEDIMKREAREEAEKALWKIARQIQEKHDITPCLFIEEGSASDALGKIAKKENAVDALILTSQSAQDGLQAALHYFTSKGTGKLNVPLIMVPTHLPFEDVQKL